MAAEAVTATVHIDATPAEVYEYFVRPEAMVTWMGQQAELDPRPGGRFAVDIEGSPVRGEYLTLEPPHRLVFTWGFAGSGDLAPGASTVEVRFVPADGGTRVEVTHDGLPPDRAARHGPGWRHFLGRLAALASST